MNDEHKDITKYIYHDNIGRVQLVQHWGNDQTIVNSARVSFGQHNQNEELSDRDKKLIKYLIKHRHTSTLEHCGATFLFVVPLFVARQHHRHRTWSYNEISRRYTDVDIKFYSPQAFRTQHESNRQASNANQLIDPIIDTPDGKYNAKSASCLMDQYHQRALNLFESMIAAGVCREQARGILPQNMYCEYYGSCNLNNLLKFIDLRTHEGAQWEIQQVANTLLDMAEDLWPTAINSWREANEKG